MGQTPKNGSNISYPADAQDIESYAKAKAGLDRMRVPILLHVDNPQERLYIAGLDGTGNSMHDDESESWSVVARIHDQIEQSNFHNISGGYVEGTFTQNGMDRIPERLWDGRFGHTFDDRVETAYHQLCTQSAIWLQQDPQAQIRVVGIGFSRGAEGVAALQRMIEERGIRDPRGAKVIMDDEGLITHIQYADRPLLVAPGRTLQAALLFDPVSTGVKEHDRRLPASTVSVLQITAEDERRDLFKASAHVPVGLSDDDRSFNAVVGGAHSDIGNTYKANGLGVLSFNLGVDFLNRLSDREYVQRQAVPIDPEKFVVHRSDMGMLGLYGTSDYMRERTRVHVDDLGPEGLCRSSEVLQCNRRDPINPELEEQLHRRTAPPEVPGHPVNMPIMKPERTSPNRSALDESIERLYAGSLSADEALWKQELRLASELYIGSPDGNRWQQQVHGYKKSEQAQEWYLMPDAQLTAQHAQEALAHKPPAMRM